MATHSSVLAWGIPGTGEPGGLPSMGLHRVGHDWSDLAAAAARPQKRNNNIVNIDFPVGQWLKCHTPNVGDLGSIPGQGTRSQMLQLRVHMLYLKILYAAMNNEDPTCRNACVHAKSLQSCPTLCDPVDCSLPGSSVHGILQARILEWVGSISFSTCAALLLLSCSSRVRLCATPETAAHQAPPSLGFSRQEHWSGLPFPSPMHGSEKSKWSSSVVSDS